MSNPIKLLCDGCGQISSPAHLAQRLQRLEWSTRCRPLHIHTLLLCASSQHEDRDFLYSPCCDFRGDAAMLLETAGISASGKTAEAVHAEFQRLGFYLTQVLECPFERESQDGTKRFSLLEQRLPAIAARIRRSLKPKRAVLISRELEPVAEKIAAMPLGCPLVLDDGKPFAFDGSNAGEVVRRLRAALAVRID